MDNLISFRRHVGPVVFLTGFIGGVLITAGIYGFVFPEKFIGWSVESVGAAYLLSTGLVGLGLVGLVLQRYVRRLLRETRYS